MRENWPGQPRSGALLECSSCLSCRVGSGFGPSGFLGLLSLFLTGKCLDD